MVPKVELRSLKTIAEGVNGNDFTAEGSLVAKDLIGFQNKTVKAKIWKVFHRFMQEDGGTRLRPKQVCFSSR